MKNRGNLITFSFFVYHIADNWILYCFPPLKYAYLIPVTFGIVFVGSIMIFTMYHAKRFILFFWDATKIFPNFLSSHPNHNNNNISVDASVAKVLFSIRPIAGENLFFNSRHNTFLITQSARKKNFFFALSLINNQRRAVIYVRTKRNWTNSEHFNRRRKRHRLSMTWLVLGVSSIIMRFDFTPI